MGAKKRPLSEDQEKFFTELQFEVDSLVEELRSEMEKSKGRLPCREFSIVMTKLEEAQMWTERGWMSLGYEVPELPEDEDEDDADADEEDSDDDASDESDE